MRCNVRARLAWHLLIIITNNARLHGHAHDRPGPTSASDCVARVTGPGTCPDVTLDARPLTGWSLVGRWAWQSLTPHVLPRLSGFWLDYHVTNIPLSVWISVHSKPLLSPGPLERKIINRIANSGTSWSRRMQLRRLSLQGRRLRRPVR
ncbi:uncharacterized protein CCOS01_07579 [Colletotrichum costaricense]|uniref:Secreted protein n=2 Tax=Colletotrichum acutatum species complex TaxID=2707335 RepID=A0AAI9YX41_9PEZI|nr:uncharacterized protein CCOS01_07579 [Colletotrichum costaricense]XP_060377881.1 uncharacterized protein CTAM01_11430 [Colletotrichum tamarilloi]KAI3531470.1 hypothetical protein CSPX01_14130 [Colletotrichum filicis]KAK1488207.1 hypothetical protein CTAM01_11430 [Colletotrichum tamarilloi]KAK1527317.1 hypothetical protein CCOS01_07579 [Colletotrichum costaricense]